MKRIIIFLLVAFVTSNIIAQQDTKAKAILDKVSAKTKNYSSIKAEFAFRMINKSENINELQYGSITVKGDKYRLKLSGQEIICNGKSIWTYIEDAEEVQINSIPEEDEEDFLSPSKIFTMYEDGFKYKYVNKKEDIEIINLYPENPEEKSFHRIALFVNAEKHQVAKVQVYGKDGSLFIYAIKSFDTSSTVEDSFFTFDKNQYPDVDVIDLRE